MLQITNSGQNATILIFGNYQDFCCSPIQENLKTKAVKKLQECKNKIRNLKILNNACPPIRCDSYSYEGKVHYPIGFP